jgi:hypothetical protein
MTILMLAAALMAAAGLWYLHHAQPGKTLLLPCMLYEFTGLYCTGCGITRALWHLLHGHPYAALRMNPLAVVSLPVLLWFVLWCLRRVWQGRPLPNMPSWVPWAALILVVAYTVARNLPWEPFSWLAPTSIGWVRQP